MWNKNHKAAQRNKVFQPKFDAKQQTIQNYAYELRTAALLLDNPLPEDQLVEQFALGLPASLSKQVHTMQGSFDEVVARIIRFDNVGKAAAEPFKLTDETREWITVDGERVRKRTGARCYKKGCTVNGGMDHFARDHTRNSPSQGPTERSGAAENGRGAATNNEGAPQN